MSSFEQPQYPNHQEGYRSGQSAPFYSQQGGVSGGQQNNNYEQQQHPNFLSGISPEMLNMGLSAGKNMFSAERDKWMPGVSTFFSALKIYFAVSCWFNWFMTRWMTIWSVVYNVHRWVVHMWWRNWESLFFHSKTKSGTVFRRMNHLTKMETRYMTFLLMFNNIFDTLKYE